MNVYEKALLGHKRRLSESVAIGMAKIKFLENIWSMYRDGLLTREEYHELFDMVGGVGDA